MKQKTQTLKRIFIFTLLTFLLACEKDDAHSHESEINQNTKFKVNRINEEKLKKNAPKIFSKIEGINNKKVNGDNNSLNRLVNINNDFLIETDEVLEVIEADRTTYTFPITRMVETDFTENLVLVIKDNGVIYGKIVKYDLSEQDKANIKSNIKVNLSNKISTTDIDNINVISAQLLRVSSDCVDYIQIGGPNCPGSLHHTLEQMASGQCPLVNSGNYVPSPEYIVQIIVDMDCDNSNNSGGVIIDESEPTYPGGNYPGGTGNTQPPTNGDTGSTNPPNDPNNNDPNPNQSFDDNPLATYPMIPSNNRTLTKLLNNLDNDQKNWWNNSATDNQKNEILDYLNQHNSTQNEAEEAIDFVKDFIDNYNDSGLDLDFEKSKKSPVNIDVTEIDTTTTEGKKFDCIYKKLMESNSFKNLFVNTFGGTQTKLNVKFEIADNLPDDVNGNCRLLPSNNGNYTNLILINKNILTGTNPHSNFKIAKTILHECIHAYLNIKKIDCNLGTTIPELDGLDLQTLIGTFYQGFGCHIDVNGSAQSQHDFIFTYLIPSFQSVFSEIRDLLASQSNIDYITNATFSNDITGNSFTWNWNDFYKYFSLAGLHLCDSFVQNIQNVPSENFYYNFYTEQSQNFTKACL